MDDILKNYLKATEETRLDVAELALTIAIMDREPWAIKYMLSTKGKSRGYIESSASFVSEEKPTPIKIEFVQENGRIS